MAEFSKWRCGTGERPRESNFHRGGLHDQQDRSTVHLRLAEERVVDRGRAWWQSVVAGRTGRLTGRSCGRAVRGAW